MTGGYFVLRLLQILNRAEEREARDRAVKYLQQAQNEITAGQFEKAIESLLNAVKKLDDIASQDMGPHILNIDLLLQEAGLKWWQGLP